MSAAAGIVGIAALGLGWWWADSAAAALVSFYPLLSHLLKVFSYYLLKALFNSSLAIACASLACGTTAAIPKNQRTIFIKQT